MKGKMNEINRDKGIYFSVALAPTQTQYTVVNVVLPYNTFTPEIIHSPKFQFKCNGVKSASV